MMSPSRWIALSRVSMAVLAMSAALAVAAAAEWREVQPLPKAPRARGVHAMPTLPPARRDGGDDVVLAAVARDPFRADRRRPPGRYRMPGEAPPPDAQAVAAAAPPAPVYAYRLLGTVVTESGGLAAIAGPNGDGRVVRAGQDIDGFRVTRVTLGSATLAGHDTTLVLRSGGTE